MKVIKWVGEKRTIPKYGLVFPGVFKSLPKKMADGFISQKLAVYVNKIEGKLK